MRELRIRDSFIKLCQALKLSGICQTGTDAKYYIESGNVRVNGEAELRRGKKLYDKDQVSIITEDGKEEEFVIFAYNVTVQHPRAEQLRTGRSSAL